LTLSGDVTTLRRLFAFVEVKTRNGDFSSTGWAETTEAGQTACPQARSLLTPGGRVDFDLPALQNFPDD